MTDQDHNIKPPLSSKDQTNKLEQTQRRRLADKIVCNEEQRDLEMLSPKETRQMLHELRVHQIELEMQNEELRRAQLELDAARARYFDLYDLAPVGYCTVSEKGLIIEANLTVANLLGRTRDALVGQPVTRFMHREDQDVFYMHRKKLLETSAPQEFDLRILKKDSTAFWARIDISLVWDADGAPLFRVIIVDITDRKRAEEALRIAYKEIELRVIERTAELKNMNEMLKRSNIALEDFAHVASHDLQEPLRKIITFGDRLATIKVSSMSEQEIDFLKRMQSAAARMQTLIQDLLKYSRVKSDPEHFKTINLRKPVEGAVEDLSLLLQETEGRIDIDDLPDATANESQMHQLFLNLIGNSLKYRSDQNPLIKIFRSPASEEGYYEIHVKDNGIGFDEIFLDKIFKPFQRLHGGSSPYKGTGMGLAICQKIVEFHEGTITAKSKPGEGSTFI